MQQEQVESKAPEDLFAEVRYEAEGLHIVGSVARKSSSDAEDDAVGGPAILVPVEEASQDAAVEAEAAAETVPDAVAHEEGDGAASAENDHDKDEAAMGPGHFSAEAASSRLDDKEEEEAEHAAPAEAEPSKKKAKKRKQFHKSGFAKQSSSSLQASTSFGPVVMGKRSEPHVAATTSAQDVELTPVAPILGPGPSEKMQRPSSSKAPRLEKGADTLQESLADLPAEAPAAKASFPCLPAQLPFHFR